MVKGEKQIKRLFLDCETSPNVGLFWSAGYKQRIDYDNIIKERAIICICYKWVGKKPEALFWDRNQDDKAMLLKFAKVIAQADEIVMHNGDRFDLPWIRTRCLRHGIDLSPTYLTIDTLKAARSKFRFNSNRLDYISKFLGIGKKIKTDFDLWKKVMANDTSAMEKMIKYCKGDVELLERIYNLMKNHLPAKSHKGILNGKGKASCPECGSEQMVAAKTRITAAGTKRLQLQCSKCGKYHTIPLIEKAK